MRWVSAETRGFPRFQVVFWVHYTNVRTSSNAAGP